MILIFCVVLFLFMLYLLSRDDFIFLRKNVSLENLFDMTFVCLLLGLLISRIIYVVFHLSSAYFNPLVFFVIPYFPGLTLSGFLLGYIASLYGLSVRQKLPVGRIFDISSVASLLAFTCFYIMQGIISTLHKHIMISIISLAIVLLGGVGYIVLQKISSKSVWQDGLVALCSLLEVIILTLLYQIAQNNWRNIPQELPIFVGVLVLFVVGWFISRIRKKQIAK